MQVLKEVHLDAANHMVWDLKGSPNHNILMSSNLDCLSQYNVIYIGVHAFLLDVP